MRSSKLPTQSKHILSERQLQIRGLQRQGAAMRTYAAELDRIQRSNKGTVRFILYSIIAATPVLHYFFISP